LPRTAALTRDIAQIKDRGVFRDSAHLGRLSARLFPRPRRFRLAWKESRASAPLFVWALEPPDDRFVALGMVTTSGPEPPAPEAARCVPRSWCEAAVEAGLEHVWNDGHGGGLWRIRQTGLLAAAKSPAVLEGALFQLRSDVTACDWRLADLVMQDSPSAIVKIT
jgi:hypothetical protein